MKMNANPATRMCITLLLLWGLSGCDADTANQDKAEGASPVVAVVGDTQIRDIDIDYEILSMPESMQHLIRDKAARARILDVMIKREAVAQKAKDMGLDRDPLIQHRLHQAVNSVLIQSVREWQSAEAKQVDDAEIAAYYKKHRKDFTVPEQIHVRHILVSDKQKAQEILNMLKRKPDRFSELAAQFSIDDSTKGRGGDLNWFSRGTMVEPFEKAAFALNEKHRLSKPVKTQFGWHVIEWLGRKQGHTPSLDEVKDEIASVLYRKSMDKWVEKLLDETDIQILKSEYARP